MDEAGFAELVQLACHDLRTPLAAVNGFSKTILRAGELGELRFVELIDEAASQMAVLIEQLGLAARIAAGNYEPHRIEANTLELAAASGFPASGKGVAVETDAATVARALAALATATVRFGGEGTAPRWTVAGRELLLEPAAEPATMNRDVGAVVALAVLDILGSVEHEGGTLRVFL